MFDVSWLCGDVHLFLDRGEHIKQTHGFLQCGQNTVSSVSQILLFYKDCTDWERYKNVQIQ